MPVILQPTSTDCLVTATVAMPAVHAALSARTFTVCWPTARLVNETGDEQAT